MTKKLAFNLCAWIITFQFVGFLLGKMTESNIITWYRSLTMPPLTPPEIVFPIVWSILYIMIAIAGWYLWENRRHSKANLALRFYAVQVIMNWLWTPIFFQFHFMQLGFYWILGIIFFNFITIVITGKEFKLATIMLTPYLFWLMFAAYLNGWIWMNN